MSADWDLFDAVRILEDAGFDVDRDEEETNQYPPGRVIGQDPAGGKRAPQGSTVTIVVSVAKGSAGGDTAVVPDVLGQTRSSAEDELRAAGFKVAVCMVSSWAICR